MRDRLDTSGDERKLACEVLATHGLPRDLGKRLTLPAAAPEGAAAKVGDEKVLCGKKWRKESDWWAERNL